MRTDLVYVSQEKFGDLTVGMSWENDKKIRHRTTMSTDGDLKCTFFNSSPSHRTALFYKLASNPPRQTCYLRQKDKTRTFRVLSTGPIQANAKVQRKDQSLFLHGSWRNSTFWIKDLMTWRLNARFSSVEEIDCWERTEELFDFWTDQDQTYALIWYSLVSWKDSHNNQSLIQNSAKSRWKNRDERPDRCCYTQL